SLAATAATFPIVAWAQTYPTRPLRLIVAYPPGGAADTVARIMGQWLSERIRQPVIIENRPGAGGNIALQAGISSPADGYTLFQIASASQVGAIFYQTMPVNFSRDGAPVAALVDFPHLFLLRPSFPAKTVPEFIAYATANPGKVSYASYGIGT